jgi:peptidoglycan/LPS O-acetylase OafA/YrhL
MAITCSTDIAVWDGLTCEVYAPSDVERKHLQNRPRNIGDDFMNRLLIFLLLFPAVAAASFYAVMYILTGAAQDGGLGPVFMYLVCTVPGLLVALLDWLVAKTSVPAVVATTVLAYGLTVLAMALLLGSSKQIVALGLIGAIPAAVCSWLSNKQNGGKR